MNKVKCFPEHSRHDESVYELTTTGTREANTKKSKGQEDGTPSLGSVTRQGAVTRERLRQVKPLGMPLKLTGIGINPNSAVHGLR